MVSTNMSSSCSLHLGCSLDQNRCSNGKRDASPNLPFFMRAANDKSDEQIHQDADVRGVGHFNYTEFLAFQDFEDDPTVRSRFDEYAYAIPVSLGI